MAGAALNAGYWNGRYLEKDTGWDLGGVSPPLKTYFDQLHNKELRILIPGAGNAYEAAYLFNSGYNNVCVCDIAAEPLKKFSEQNPAFDKARLIQQDFFNLNMPGFDLIMEQTFFCALHPSFRQKYFEKMYRLLNPGGRLVGVLFNDKLNADHPPFGGNKEEYLSYITQDFKIKTFEACYNSIKPRQGRELFINLVNK